ncbi:MAG: hypothetical protein ACOH1Y_09265 [Propionicimonas sp.]
MRAEDLSPNRLVQNRFYIAAQVETWRPVTKATFAKYEKAWGFDKS